jgi:hypothetical protein
LVGDLSGDRVARGLPQAIHRRGPGLHAVGLLASSSRGQLGPLRPPSQCGRRLVEDRALDQRPAPRPGPSSGSRGRAADAGVASHAPQQPRHPLQGSQRRRLGPGRLRHPEPGQRLGARSRGRQVGRVSCRLGQFSRRLRHLDANPLRRPLGRRDTGNGFPAPGEPPGPGHRLARPPVDRLGNRARPLGERLGQRPSSPTPRYRGAIYIDIPILPKTAAFWMGR